MTISGWKSRYSEIIKEFGYSKKEDLESARMLNSLLKNGFRLKNFKKLIYNQPVFVVGAGPSLLSSITILKKYKKVTKIVADGATEALLENNIMPDIVVSDLDGDIKSLTKVGKTKTIVVVHAHADNFDKLDLVKFFKNCIGTTQTESI